MSGANDSTALAEGRRIYLGNLPYSVSPSEVEEMLQTNGYTTEAIHMSVDPISGRNPGYCFLEFVTRDEAERALNSLPGTTIRDRGVKVGPCQPKSQPRTQRSYEPKFQRWGNWHQEDDSPSSSSSSSNQGPNAAISHLEQNHSGRRVFVTGLPPMMNQVQNDLEMRELFKGFEIVAIGKRVIPFAKRGRHGNHHYCLIDFSSIDEASRAQKAKDGTVTSGGQTLGVSIARGQPRTNQDREHFRKGPPALAVSNWRTSQSEPQAQRSELPH